MVSPFWGGFHQGDAIVMCGGSNAHDDAMVLKIEAAVEAAGHPIDSQATCATRPIANLPGRKSPVCPIEFTLAPK